MSVYEYLYVTLTLNGIKEKMPFFLPKRAISKYDLPEQQLFIQNEIKFFRELADDMLCSFFGIILFL